jgi:hypothetical protein
VYPKSYRHQLSVISYQLAYKLSAIFIKESLNPNLNN